MNKKLIAAAIAAAVAAPAANADATVYGQLKVWVASTDAGESMSTSGSRLGFKGSEDLGNGLKAVFKLEYGLDFDDPGASGSVTGPVTTTATAAVTVSSDNAGITSRSQYVGLAGNFGTVMFGKRETNYLLSTAKLDFFADTLADYNKTVGFQEGGADPKNARPNNAIHYVSPSFSGLSVSGALYGNDTVLDNAWDVAVVYKNGGIHASAAHSDMASSEANRFGLGYKMDAFAVSAIYEDQAGGANLWQVQGAYTMGNNTLKAMYGDNDGGTNAWAIGVDHKMSKRTKVYALYADGNTVNADNAVKGGDSGFAIGMQHNF